MDMMGENDSFQAPRNSKQIRNKKYRETSKESPLKPVTRTEIGKAKNVNGTMAPQLLILMGHFHNERAIYLFIGAIL